MLDLAIMIREANYICQDVSLHSVDLSPANSVTVRLHSLRVPSEWSCLMWSDLNLKKKENQNQNNKKETKPKKLKTSLWQTAI